MGLLSKLFGKRHDPPERGQGLANLAFVLLSEPRLPDAKEIARVFRDFAAPGEELQTEADEAGKSRHDVVSLTLSTGESSFVALVPAAVPNGEAEEAAQFSMSSHGSDWKLPTHCAHLLVTWHAAVESSPAVQLSRFTSLLAATTKSSPAVGVYWGNAGATHDPVFFLSVASDQEVFPRIMLWSGISVARESDGRPSLLSLGMRQLDLPDLLLVASKGPRSVAFETMFNFLAYVAERGEGLAEGDTIGRTADERLLVRYVPSPIDAAKKVWRVDLP